MAGGIAVPGTVVPVGALTTPGGAQGVGANSWTLSTASFTVPNAGATAVMNVGDTSWAVVGEFVWVATAGGSPTSPMALQVTAKTPTSLTLLNPPTFGTAVSGDAGNLAKLGSDSLVYVPGGSSPFVFGASAAQSGFPSGLSVPRYANHPDQIWTPYGPFDDHFDSPASGTPNSKWVQSNTSGIINPVFTQAASKLCLGGQSPAANNTYYNNFISQTLPAGSTHTVTVCFDVVGFAYNASGISAVCYASFALYYGANAGGIEVDTLFYSSATVTANMLRFFNGSAFGTLDSSWTNATFPRYLRFVYDASQNTTIQYSMDGVTWMNMNVFSGSASGFATNAPAGFRMGIVTSYISRIFMQVDWIKRTA